MMGAASPGPSGPAPLRSWGLAAFDALASDTLMVFWPRDARPLRGAAGYLDWRMCGALSRSLERGLFQAQPDEVMLVPTQGRLGRRRVFVFGVKAQPAWEKACRSACQVVRDAGAQAVTVVAPPAEDQDAFVAALVPAAREVGLGVAEILIDPDV